MEQEISESEIEIRRLQPIDADGLAAQFRAQGLTLVGMGSEAFLRAFVGEALSDWRVSIVIAAERGNLVGWSVAIINPRAFWKKFFLRHPLLAIPAIRKRLTRRRSTFSEANRQAREPQCRTPCQQTWNRGEVSDWGASRNNLAKHIDITVAESRRGAGVGRKLQDGHLRELSETGVTRVDAVISTRNSPSIHFHIKQDWTLVNSTAQTLYVTKTLPGKNSSDELPWSLQPLRLSLTLGEIRFFTFRFEGIRSDPNVFDVAEFDDVPVPAESLRQAGRKVAYMYSCPVKSRIPQRSFTNGYLRYVASQYRHFYVDVSGDFAEYLGNFRSKTKSMLKRKVKKASSSNACLESFRAYATADEMDHFFSAARSVSVKSYQHTLLGQGLPEDDEFRQAVRQKAAQGQVKGFVLFVEDTPVAYNLCPTYGDQVVLYDYTGYDPAFSDYSPGTVLQYKVIEYLFADEDSKIYDLCTGEGQHKELFATGAKLCANIYFFPSGLGWRAVVFTCVCMNRISSGVKTGLERVALKGWLKKMIRRGWR